ncbi:MAG: hypothetical protein K2K90_18585 [Lachnospiraceae bacterium]|nr:hypothetical protein [Lachnospiraceae bacterium]
MKQMNIMKIKAARERHRLLLSIIIVLALLLLTWSLIPIVFETNDDSFMMGYLAGAWTGKPEVDTIFSLFLWGRIVSALYVVNAGIPWYTLIFLALIFLSLTVVCYCLMASFPKWGEGMFCLLYFCMFLYYTVLLQFTMVSAYCGVAALSLLLINKKEEGRRNCIIRNIIIFFFMFFAVNIRSKVGYLTLGSAAFAVSLEIIRYLLKAADRQKIKKAIVSFIVLCVAVGLSICAHKIHESRNGWEDFREYHAERARFTDYTPLDYMSNQELFQQIGWSEDFYQLLREWFLMDETINTETFQMINERNAPVATGVRWALSHDFPRIGFQSKVWALLMFLLFVDALRHRKGGLVVNAVPFLWLLLWLAETWYFAHSGRLMERAFEAWTLLAVVPSILGMGVLQSREPLGESEKGRMENAVVYVLALVLCIVCACHADGGYRGAKDFSQRSGNAQTRQAASEDYAMAHPENVYIGEMSLLLGAGGPWRVYSEGKPYNLIFWGASYYHSPLYYAQLERNGLEHLYEEDFFRENVYLMAGEEPNKNLLNVMAEKFPGCTYEITEKRDEFIVYQFHRTG